MVSTLRFGVKTNDMNSYQRKNFMNGPGKLCKGLGVDKDCNGLSINSNELYLADEIKELGLLRRSTDFNYYTGKRIGIDYAEEAIDFPWRFWIKEDGSC